MTTADTESMQALQELLAERQRYEGWMRALEARASTTPPHVFSRVHTDYSLRLERVMQRLSERTEHVRSTIDAMSSRLAGLRSRETDRTDARQEAELRALVGEYTDEEWSKIRDEADLEIELIAEERSGVESELAEMERILGLTRPSQTPVAPAEQPAVREETSSAGQVTQATASSSQPIPRLAVFPEATASTSANSSASRPAEDAPSIDDFVADWPVRHIDATAPQAQGDGIAEVPEVDEPQHLAVSSEQSRGSEFDPSAVIPQAAVPALEPRREQEKTLKCPECATMNYATEWYCERCGGELATF